jgi:microcystin-dependent protein
MATPFVGEIRMFAGNFAPAGWQICAGQTLSIADYEVLFTLIGTTYGGDGQATFRLPDLQGRVPVHQGNGHVLGQVAGTETVTLNLAQMPAHTHAVGASSALSTGAAGPTGVLAASSLSLYGSAAPTTAMAAAAISALGGSQPHENMAPFGVINYIIALFGVFPTQNRGVGNV